MGHYDGLLIESGWYSEEDAENRKRQLMSGKVLTRAKAIEIGFDPSVNVNWRHKALSGLGLSGLKNVR